MKTALMFVIALLCTINATAGNLSGEYESRSSGDKVNLFYKTSHLEVFTLKNANLQLEAGPRFSLGKLTVVTKLGGTWNLKDSTLTPTASCNLFFSHGRLTALSVNDFSLQDVRFSKSYQEGFLMINLNDVVNGCSVGCYFEHYQIQNRQTWVIGPRLTVNTGNTVVKSVSLWAGLTDNPTAGVFITF